MKETVAVVGREATSDVDSETLDNWRKDVGLLDDELFAIRLKSEGLSGRELAHLVRQWEEEVSPLPIAEEEEPERPRETPRSRPSLDTSPWSHWTEEEKVLAPFLTLASPWVEEFEEAAWLAIRDRSSRWSGMIDDIPLYESLRSDLWRAPLELLAKSAIVELHQSNGGEAEALEITGEGRFERFIERCGCADGRLAFFGQYPLLLPLIRQRLRLTHGAQLEALDRLMSDADEIHASMFAATHQPARLSSLRMGLGDHHAGGRSVAMVGYDNGQRLIYKPRSLAVEDAFFGLVQWLNALGLQPDQRAARILARQDYGYMEYIAPNPLKSPLQVARYYERLGGLIALIYLLNGTDLHYENLVAHGEYPCAIDLETLMHPLIPSADNPQARRSAVQDTVLWGLLLPVWHPGRRPGAMDVSGIASSPSFIHARVPVDAGTPQLRYEVRRIPFARQANVPFMDDQAFPAHASATDIRKGFEATYIQLIRHRRELTGPNGPLVRFRGVTTRVVLRGTKVYASLLSAMRHPHTLKRRLEVERLLERLWIFARTCPGMAACVPAERTALWRGDVPLFHVRTDETTVRDCFNRPLGPLFVRTGWQELTRRIRLLGPRDMRRQARIVEHSARSLRPAEQHTTWPLEAYPATATHSPAGHSASRMQAQAQRLAHYILDSTLRSGSDVVLLQNAFETNAHYAMKPIGWDLYEGLAGIALFLAQVDRALGDAACRRGARAMLRSARRLLESSPQLKCGAFAGIAGWIYALYSLGLLWNEPELQEEALGWLPRLKLEIDRDSDFDLIGGAAGALWVLMRIHHHRHDDRVLQTARYCGEHLLTHASAVGSGLAWKSPMFEHVAMTGLSHGASGIAVALAWLGDETGDPRFSETARSALDFESDSLDADTGTWTDARSDRNSDETHSGTINAWCHGAPGIGLARLYLPASYQTERWQAEVLASIHSTRSLGFGASHCLCHGDLGNIDLLIAASNDARFEPLAEDWPALASKVVERVEQGPRCGSHTHTEILGMMCGIAGIGYGLLRCAEPERVPSILALELPRG